MKAHKFVADFGIERAKAVLGECESFKCVEKPTHFDIDLDIFIHEKDFVELDESDVDLSELKQVVDSIEIVKEKGGLTLTKGLLDLGKHLADWMEKGSEKMPPNKPDKTNLIRCEKAIADYELVESFKSKNDQIVCWSCNQNMSSKQRGNNDGFCIHCGAEIEVLDMTDVSPCCAVRNG